MVDREQDRASARVGGRSVRGSLLCPARAWLRNVAHLCSSWLPRPRERMEREKRRGSAKATEVWTQREVMSLSALSSSSLMALYFIFCA